MYLVSLGHSLLLEMILIFVKLKKAYAMIAGDCPDGWLLYEGQCYGLPKDNKLPWPNAEFYCQSWSAGAHLASIHSAEEQKFVRDNFPQNIWLGGSDLSQEDTWVWTDGTLWNYDDWHPGQPDDYKARQDCASLDGVEFKWDDNGCGDNKLFLCKK